MIPSARLNGWLHQAISGAPNLHHLIYLALFAIVCGLAAIKGGKAEWAGAMILWLGDGLSILAARPLGFRWVGFEPGILVVDLGVFLGFLWLALRSDRFWPMWAAAFMLAEVGAHLARPLAGQLPLLSYATSIVIWVYPILASILIGTIAHIWETRTSSCSSAP